MSIEDPWEAVIPVTVETHKTDRFEQFAINEFSNEYRERLIIRNNKTNFISELTVSMTVP